jgi:hypothetical protein
MTTRTDMGARAGGGHDAGTRSPVQLAALVFGAVFLLVGIAGFIPGITTNYDDLSFAGHDGAELLGLFEVNVLHNIAHLAFGVGILMSRTARSARTYLIAAGAIYAVLFLYGLIVDHGSDANFIALNDADNVLHIGLAAALLLAGFLLPGPDRDRDVRAART